MRKAILIGLVFFLGIGGLEAQRSPDKDFNRIEKLGFEQERLGNYDEAIKIYRSLQSHPAATCLTKGREAKFIAYALGKQNKVEESMEVLLTEALPVWESCEALKKSYLVSPYNYLAELYLILKKPEKCLEYSHKVIQLYNTGNGRENEYTRLTNAFTYSAAAYSMMGNYKLAEKYLEAARYNTIQKVKEVNKPYFLYKVLDENIRVQLAEENYDEVIRLTNETRKHITNKENPVPLYPIEEFALSVNVTKAYLNEGDLESVKGEIEIMDQHLEEIGSLDAKTQYYQILAEYKSAQGNFEEAIAHLKTAKSFADQQADDSNQAINKLNLAQIYFENGKEDEANIQIAKAIGDLTGAEALEILGSEIDLEGKEVINYDDLFQVLTEFYQMRLSVYEKSNNQENLDQAIAIFNEMDYLVKSSRNTYESEFSQLNHLEKLYGMYEVMIGLLVDRGEVEYHRLAAKYCMDNKSTILANEARKKGLNQQGYSESEKASRIKLNRKLFDIENQYLTVSEDLKDSINIDYLKEVTNSYLLNLELSKTISNDRISDSYSNINIGEVIESLPQNTALIEIYYGEKYVYIFRVLNNAIEVEKIPLTNENKYFLTSVIGNLIEEGPLAHFKTHSKVVFDNFFSTLINEGAPIEKVIVVADGLFHDLPLETLYDGNGYLIEKYNFQNLYSSQVLLDDKQQSNHDYIGFGTAYTSELNSKLSSNYNLQNIKLASLPNAELEIKNGEQIIGGTSYVGDQSSKASFVQKAGATNGILHFALHGLILDDYTSAILFDDRDDDFMLTSSEVYSMDINNYLSILSACYSADGRIYAGEGVRSLGRAFLAAGSQNIISSLWASSDQANEMIMTSFFRGVTDGKDLSLALSDSKREYLAAASPSMRHPSNWGNLVLIGMGENGGDSYNLWLLGLLVLGAFIGVILLVFRGKYVGNL